LIEAVVGLPENLFQNVSIPSAILVLNAEKPEHRSSEIQFINAADEEFYTELSNQNELLDEGIDHITSIFKDWKTIERRARTVSHEEVAENDQNLNIALYVDTTEPEEDINVEDELAKLRELQNERDEIEPQMSQHMEVLDYE